MIIWEYKRISGNNFRGDEDVLLLAMGSSGWELAAVAKGNIYIFKRPK